MKRLAAGLTTFRLGDDARSAAIAVALTAAAWFAGTWTTTSAREADLERIAVLGRSAALASAIGALRSFAAHTTTSAVVIAVVQMLCCLGVVYFAWHVVRSPAVAVIAGLSIVASPFPEHWFARPSGLVDGFVVVALLVTFAGLLDGALPARPRSAIVVVSAFAAVLLSGWAWVALLVPAACVRGRTAFLLGVAVAAALVARIAAGLPPPVLAGHWSAYGAHALLAVRLLIAAAIATPAIIFVCTRPRVELGKRFTRSERALVTVAAVLALVAGFLVADAPVWFAAQLALTLAAISVAARTSLVPSFTTAACIGGVALGIGLLVRPPAYPADDVAVVTRERQAIRDAAPAFVLVDHGDAALRSKYSADHLAYVAGRPVDVRYLERPPAGGSSPVLDATPVGVRRIDGLLRTTAAFARSRRDVRFDFIASGASGTLNSRTPQGTPSGLGVVPRLPQPGPDGPIDAIVVVSGFSDTFRNVRVEPGDRLVYLVAKALPNGQTARATVSLDVAGGPPLAVSDDVPPWPGGGSLLWVLRDVPLRVRSATTVTLRFAASSPSGRNVGDWIAFANPAIVGRSR